MGLPDPCGQAVPGGPARLALPLPSLTSLPPLLSLPPLQSSSVPIPPPLAALPAVTASADADLDLAGWLRLALTAGIGPVRGHRLLAQIGRPAAIPSMSREALSAGLGSPALAGALLADDPARDAQLVAALAWRRADPERHHLITAEDPRYPERLRHLHDPPLLLYVLGDPACLGRRQLAVVGSRRATALGLETAASLAQALAAAGWTVTSGLAEGIDRAAHEGALQAVAADASLGATTVAVMGTGIDRIYPARHRALAQRIVAAEGALVSELAPGIGPMAASFPRRNRLIAALADGVLVVEAAQGSGSLITARLALEIGREVFAVPGSIHSPQSRGCHRLLREGAGLVETLDDILTQFRPTPGQPPRRRAARWEPLVEPPPEPLVQPPREPTRQALQEAPGAPSGEAPGKPLAGPVIEPAPGSTPDPEPDQASFAPSVVEIPDRAALSVSHHKACPDAAEVRHDRDSDPDTAALLDLLAGGPADADRLQHWLGWPIARLLARLQRLEIAGILGRDLAGHWFRTR